MPTNNDEKAKSTLREKTQNFRDKARRILRMEMINEILQEIFQVNKELNFATKRVEGLTETEASAEKIVARAEYKMSKLDGDDPDYEEKIVKATAFVETETKRQAEILEQINSDIKFNKKKIEDYTKQIEGLDKEVEAVESGETKVSIDEMNDLAQTLIAKS